jgi:diguanylate cyclase (GGDEF)-like protein
MTPEDRPATWSLLVVDDNPINLGVVAEHLVDEGFEVLVALDGEEALKRAAHSRPHLILLDVMMPGIDGFETCRRLKAAPGTQDIPVIFMTALDDVADKVAAFDAGGVDFISKPFQFRELLARVRTHLALRDARERVIAQNEALEQEMAARAEAEARIRYNAMHDSLTGLPNRATFLDSLGAALGDARKGDCKVAVLAIGLDHFRAINDAQGHLVGDQMLESVAARMIACLRPEDTAARIGGDEFVVALPNIEGATEAQTVADALLKALNEPLLINGTTLRVTGSIGISIYPDDGSDATGLIRAADAAMYRAKKGRRGSIGLFAHNLSTASERWHTLSRDIAGACERGELQLHYQPLVSVAERKIIGAEALLRWNHPTLGMIQPDLFIPLLEERGMMVEVGRWVIQTACREAMRWRAEGLPAVRMAVNLSAQQFYHDDLVNTVARALEKSGLDAKGFELELTESLALDDSETMIRIMSELKSLGISLSLDDFGTGWSSLAYLRRFPLDRLKIDRTFIRDLSYHESAAAIVHSIVELARQLGLDCLAEGVETEAQRAFLLEEHCPSMQGFLFSQPLAAEQMRTLLQEHMSTDRGQAA